MSIKRIFRRGGVDPRTGKARADHFANVHVSDEDVADQKAKSAGAASGLQGLNEEFASTPSAESVALGRRMEIGVLHESISADLESSDGDYRVADSALADDMHRALGTRTKFMRMMNNIHESDVTPSPEDAEKLREIDGNLSQLEHIVAISGGGHRDRPSDIHASALEIQSFYELRAEVKSQVDGFLGDYSRSEVRKTVDGFLDNPDSFTAPNPSDYYSFVRDGRVISSENVLAESLNDSLRSDPTHERFVNSLKVAAKLSDEGRDDLALVVARNTFECRKDNPSLHGTDIPNDLIKGYAKLLTSSGIMGMK